MTHTFAIASQKGGVGKTTTAVTLGHGLALSGVKTLIVDADPQGHVARMLNTPKRPGLRQWFYDEQPLASCVVNTRPNLDILPGDKTTEKVLGKIRDESYGEQLFADQLINQTTAYQVVIIDLAPSLNNLQVAAILAADYAIIPTRLRYTDLDGVQEVIRTIAEVARHGHTLTNFYILPTFYDRTTTETHARFRELVAQHASRIWPPISHDTKLSEAPGHGQTIWEYAPKTNGIVGFANAAGKRIGGYACVVDQIQTLIGM